VIVAGLIPVTAVIIARLVAPGVIVAVAEMVMAPLVMVLAFVALALVLLMVGGRVIGTVGGQGRAGAADRQDQGSRDRCCGSLEHSLSPLSDEWIAVW
jgi:hypothetical protein